MATFVTKARPSAMDNAGLGITLSGYVNTTTSAPFIQLVILQLRLAQAVALHMPNPHVAILT